MVGANGQGTWVKGSVAPVLASESASSFSGNPAWPRIHWKLRATWEERELERSQISQKDFGWRNAGAVQRRARVDLESIRKRCGSLTWRSKRFLCCLLVKVPWQIQKEVWFIWFYACMFCIIFHFHFIAKNYISFFKCNHFFSRLAIGVKSM